MSLVPKDTSLPTSFFSVKVSFNAAKVVTEAVETLNQA
jgi:hypothetical protein